MRFKAVINEGSAALNFARAIHGLAKLTKGCALRITKNDLNFVSDNSSSHGRARYCVRINQKTIFSLFELNGVEETNDICLQLNAVNLSKTLKYVTHHTRAISIKLSKRKEYDAVLNIVIEQPSDSVRRSRSVTYDVPIYVISHETWNELQIPTPLPSPTVNVLFGPFKALASLVSKMRLMDKKVTFAITPNYIQKTAVVEMSTYSHVCRSSSRFKACEFVPINENAEQRVEDNLTETDSELETETTISVSVESNILHTLLSSFADHSASMKLGVCDHGFALIYLIQQEVRVMCLLPHFNQN